MNTTLTPPPTDREREMLAEWVGRLSVVQLPNGYLSMGKESMFDYAEELLTEFRTRYGVTGAEPEPIREADDITMTELLNLLPDTEERPHPCIMIWKDNSGYAFREGVKHIPESLDGVDYSFSDIPELIAILKGGESE